MNRIAFILAVLALALSSACNDSSDKPLTADIYLFGIPNQNGNMGGISGANALCQSAYNSTYSSVMEVANVKAFISATGYSVKDIIISPGSKGVYGVKSSGTATKIQSSWAELWNTSNSPLIFVPMQDAIDTGGNQYWWSGSQNSGVYHGSPPCSEWTATTGQTGMCGQNIKYFDMNWIESNLVACPDTNTLVCVGWN